MALSHSEPIAKNDIASIEYLDKGRIIILIGQNDEKVVLKYEKTALDKKQVKQANAIMQSVDSKIGTVHLTEAEAEIVRGALVLDAALRKHFSADQTVPADVAEASQKALNLLTGENFHEDGTSNWMKMDYIKNKDLQTALEKRLNNDKSGVKVFIAALKKAKGLESLGKIIACDLFLGNQDRILPTRKQGGKLVRMSKVEIKGAGSQVREFVLYTIANLGNVFAGATDAGYVATGLDHVDPNSHFKNIKQPLAEIETADFLHVEGPWPFRSVVDKAARTEFAAAVIKDLELVLHPNKSPNSPLTKLGRDAVARLSAGMVQGAKEIKKTLEQKYKAGKVEAKGGIKDRYDVLLALEE